MAPRPKQACRASRPGIGLWLWAALAAGCAPGAPPPPLCLLISVDTLRADALSCYGGPPGGSPNLAALAERGVRFDYALAQAPNTATSHASLFTGLLPFAHRVANLTSLEHGTPGLAPGYRTLAESFAEAGFDTAAFTDDGPLGAGWNLMQGFEHLQAALEGAEAKVDGAHRWLAARASRQPAFLFLHTYETHQPFAPSAADLERFDPGYGGPLRGVWADLRAQVEAGAALNDGRALLAGWADFGAAEIEFLRALYQAEVYATDRALGRLLAEVEARFGPQQALVALTSDHGEEFREHGRFGHEQLFVETLRVPLLLALPGGRCAGRSVGAAVSQFDLMPTLLELCGIAPPEDLQAESLLPYLADSPGAGPERELIAETTEGLYAPLTGQDRLRSRRAGGFAYLERAPSPEPGAPRRNHPLLPYGALLFDLRADPGEASPVAGTDRPSPPALRGRLEGAARRLDELRLRSEALAARWSSGGLVPADAATVDQLRRLGYLPKD
jgi:arylsulfatase A-like enzyme